MPQTSLKRVSFHNGFKIEWIRLTRSTSAQPDRGCCELACSRVDSFSSDAQQGLECSGVFLATVALYEKGQRFSVERRDGRSMKTELGAFAEIQWLDIPNRFPGVSLDHYELMPSRITGLVIVPDEVSDVEDGCGYAAVTIDEILGDTTQELRRLILSSGSRIPSFPMMVRV